MAVSDDHLAWLLEQLEELGPVVPKRMFGGVGLYFDGTFFGVVDDDTLYFRADDRTRPLYQERGMGAFQPIPTAKPMTGYWQVPDDVIGEPATLAEWARDAVAASRARKSAKPKRASRGSASRGSRGARPRAK